MSDTNQFDNILPIAPLKIAALESSMYFAKKVDNYLVDFRKTANMQHRDNVYFQEYAAGFLPDRLLLSPFWNR